MTIESIEISNFQSHEYTILDFDSGVNVIKGTSHHGKSSIIRALEWALFNRPKGEGFKSHFAEPKEDVSVGIAFTDDWILRLKGKENNYLADNLDLKALRTDVPDEIKAITQIDEVNFQSQSDSYFLIQDSPGIAGKKLNKLVGLEIIDEVRTKINQMVSKLNSRLELTTEEIESTGERLEDYKHVKKAERLVNRIDTLEGQKVEIINRSQGIKETIDWITANQKLISDLKGWLDVEKEFHKLSKQLNILGDQQRRYSKLFHIVSSLNAYSSTVEEKQIVVDLEPQFKKIKKDQEKLTELISHSAKIKMITHSIRTLKGRRDRLNKSLESKHIYKSELETKLNYCSECGSLRKYWRREYAKT